MPLDMGESVGLPPKQDVMKALLEGSSVYLHLDPRREGVVVPQWLKNQPQLVLQVGFALAVRIPDLDVGDEGVSCTLSFNRSPFWCHLPWSAVYGLVGEDGRGMIWPDDVPIELSGPPRAKPRLEAVPQADASGTDKGVEPAAASPRKPAGKRGVGKKPAPESVAVAVSRSGGQAGGKRPGSARARSRSEARADTPPLLETPPTVTSTEARGQSEASDGDTPSTKRKLPPYLRVVK